MTVSYTHLDVYKRQEIDGVFSDCIEGVIFCILPTGIARLRQGDGRCFARLQDGERHRHIPVSYTHLDVYKRQVHTGIVKVGGHGVVCASVQGHIVEGHAGDVRVCRAIDVYKRQVYRLHHSQKPKCSPSVQG